MSVLEKATQILDVVAEAPDGATLTGIAQRLHQPRSSTHRLLSELVQLGMLMKIGGANYLPGPRLARWGASAGGTRDVVRLAKPAMVRLRDGIGESVHLYVRQRDRRVCVLAVEGSYELRHFSEVGKPLPLSVGASGKVLLAFADPATQAQELRRLAGEPPTRRAPSPEDLEAQLVSIRRTGWSMSFGEREEGLAAAAVPIREHDGSILSALSVSGPTARLSAERLRALRPQLGAAADEVSRALGWSPAPQAEMAHQRRRAALSRSSAGS
jgi:DNA-binding IclR family transcriptional regulator